MTWIFLSPAAVRMTSNSDFSSSAPPPSPPPPAGRRGGGDGHRGRRGHAEALLELLEQLAQLENGQLGDAVQNLVLGQGACHCLAPCFVYLGLVRCGSVYEWWSGGAGWCRSGRGYPRGFGRDRRRPPRCWRRPRRRPRRPAASGWPRSLLRGVGRCFCGGPGRPRSVGGSVACSPRRASVARPGPRAPRHRPDAARSGPRARRPDCGAAPGPGRPAAGAVRPARRRTGPAASPSRGGRPAPRCPRPTAARSPTMPPLTTRLGLFLAKSRRALATALTSPWTKAIAVGPVSRSWIGAWGPSATARRTRVFL